MAKTKTTIPTQDAEFFSFLEGAPATPLSQTASEVVLDEVPAAVNKSLSVDVIVRKAIADLQALEAKMQAQKADVIARIADLGRKIETQKTELAGVQTELAELDKVRARNDAAAKALEKLAADDAVEYSTKAKKAA